MTPGSVASLIDLLNEKGGAAYFGEPVSQLEHSLQAAHCAELAGAGDAQITAALLHDIGHMLHGMEEDIAARGLNTRHEEIAADYLAQWFGEEVTAPIRLHVPAKRFLCWSDPRYLEQLSPASIESLALQGGPMNDRQAAIFLISPFAHQSVALRKWDDEAKIPGLKIPAADYYLPRLRATASARPTA
jgi:[1-hydroxy-2-(trimethylamino)ethyl]phosphonate dioxygenase